MSITIPSNPHLKVTPLEPLYHFALIFYNEGDISRTAQNLDVQPRDIIRSIDEIETALGIPLVDRQPGDPVRPGDVVTFTRAGQVLLSHSAHFLCSLDEIEHTVRVASYIPNPLPSLERSC